MSEAALDLTLHANCGRTPKTVPEHYQTTLDVLGWLSPPAEQHARAVCTFPQVWACCPIPHDDLEKAVAALAVASAMQRTQRKK